MKNYDRINALPPKGIERKKGHNKIKTQADFQSIGCSRRARDKAAAPLAPSKGDNNG